VRLRRTISAAAGFLILLPLGFLVTGGVIWWRRRKA